MGVAVEGHHARALSCRMVGAGRSVLVGIDLDLRMRREVVEGVMPRGQPDTSRRREVG